MSRTVHISLANKCQLLFGLAVVMILTAALAVVWQRMQKLVNVGLEETAHVLAQAYVANMIEADPYRLSPRDPVSDEWDDLGIKLTVIAKEDFDSAARRSSFVAEAIERFETHRDRHELHRTRTTADEEEPHLFARAIRKSDRARSGAEFSPSVVTTDIADPLESLLVIEMMTAPIEQQQMLNRIYIVAAGLLAGLLAIGVFWFITTRIILFPVRVLRDTAEQVTEGDLNIRADINTGDEFEQLSDAFNHMLETINANQEDLRGMNKSLDLKLGELAEHNVALFEADKIKGEFLANVSHELRTPLNSIVGFAEVLGETLEKRTGPVDEKRKRYIANIIASSRQLLDLINDLLDLAKIEAGRMEVRTAAVSIADTVEALSHLIRPQTEKRAITLITTVERGIPVVHTDESRVQQIIFNFLSNAVKFTPDGGRIELSARVVSTPTEGEAPQVYIGVRDSGPGIPATDHDRIFEKFTQLDSTVTRQYSGTGLGLTISRDLARLLRGHIELDSVEGDGATFGLVIPVALEPRSVPLMPEMGKG